MNNIQKEEYNFYDEPNKIDYVKINLYNDDDLELCPWVLKEEKKNGDIKFKVLHPILAEYIRKNCYYLFVKNRVKDSVQRFFYSDGYYKQITDDEFKGYIKSFIPLELHSTRTISEVQGLLYTDLVYEKDTNLNPKHIINFKNGIFNLKTWKMERHSPKYKSTIQIPCDYDPDTKIPEDSVFDTYMNHLTYDKADRRKFLLQFMGIALSNVPGYMMKSSLFMVGEHDTGKTQLKELCGKLIGSEYYAVADLQKLEARFGSSKLYNRRIVGSNDMSYVKVTEMNIFKQATGGDTIDIEYKSENSFEYKYQGVLWFCCNKLPKFGGDKGDGVYNRIIPLECSNPVAIKNKGLLDEMYEERDYIITLAIQGLKEVIDNGYNYDIPEDCKKHTEKYKIENDSFLTFLDECIIPRDDKMTDRITCSIFHKIYQAWCKDNGSKFYIGKKECNKMLEKKGLATIKATNGVRYFADITINNETISDYKHLIPLSLDL